MVYGRAFLSKVAFRRRGEEESLSDRIFSVSFVVLVSLCHFCFVCVIILFVCEYVSEAAESRRVCLRSK
jgi:hypothetical protein